MANHQVGDLVPVTGTFTINGTASDPDVVHAWYKDPSGNETTLTYGVDAAVVKSSVGVYYTDIDADEAGAWYYRWYSTGDGQTADNGWFIVEAAGAPTTYGTVGDVGALVPLYATATGTTFSSSTRPTLAQVQTMIKQVSAVVNVLLAEAGFSIPITQVTANDAMTHFVVMETAALVEYANGAGPFTAQQVSGRAGSPQQWILEDAEKFIHGHAEGLELLGATRTRSLTNGLDAVEVDAVFSWSWTG